MSIKALYFNPNNARARARVRKTAAGNDGGALSRTRERERENLSIFLDTRALRSRNGDNDVDDHHRTSCEVDPLRLLPGQKRIPRIVNSRDVAVTANRCCVRDTDGDGRASGARQTVTRSGV